MKENAKVRRIKELSFQKGIASTLAPLLSNIPTLDRSLPERH